MKSNHIDVATPILRQYAPSNHRSLSHDFFAEHIRLKYTAFGVCDGFSQCSVQHFCTELIIWFSRQSLVVGIYGAINVTEKMAGKSQG